MSSRDVTDDGTARRPLGSRPAETGFLGAHLVRAADGRPGARHARARRWSQQRRRRAWLRALGVEICSTGSRRASPDDMARARSTGVDRDLSPGRPGLAQAGATAHRMYAVHVDGTRVCARRRRAPGVHAHRDVLDQRHGRGLAARRRDARRDVADADRHRRALAVLREQALSGRDGAPRLRRQGRAGDAEPEPAARARATIASARRGPSCSSSRARSR